MESYKPSVVSNVESAIVAMNKVVSLLHCDEPLASQIIEVNYRAEVVEEFTQSSHEVLGSLRLASETTTKWFDEVGRQQAENLERAREISQYDNDTSAELRQANEHIKATENGVADLEGRVRAAEHDLEAENHALAGARHELQERRNFTDSFRIATYALFFLAPIMVPILVVNENAVREHEGRVSAIENGLNESRARLQGHRDELTAQKARCAELSSRIAHLKNQAAGLAEEKHNLANARTSLAQLTTRINDCLHAVSGAMSSSAVIADAGSMRDVVAGLRGVADSLGRDEMFEGPVAKLDDVRLVALTHRVAAIKSHRLTF